MRLDFWLILCSCLIFVNSYVGHEFYVAKKTFCFEYPCQKLKRNTQKIPRFYQGQPNLQINGEWNDFGVSGHCQLVVTRNNTLFASNDAAKFVFVEYSAIDYFVSQVLPKFHGAVTVIVGDDGQRQHNSTNLGKLGFSSKIVHVFSEVEHPSNLKVSSLPLARTFHKQIINKPLTERARKLLLIGRVDIPAESIFYQVGNVSMIGDFTFVLCDDLHLVLPAILAGAIPVIERNGLADAYEQLPVIIVSDVQTLLRQQLNEKLFSEWFAAMAHHYEFESELRRRALLKLTTAYWFNYVHHKSLAFQQGRAASTNNTVLSEEVLMKMSAIAQPTGYRSNYTQSYPHNLLDVKLNHSIAARKYCNMTVCRRRDESNIAVRINVYHTHATREIKVGLGKGSRAFFLGRGIAALFDWLVVERHRSFALGVFANATQALVYGNVRVPSTVFVATTLLPFFMQEVLPRIRVPVVLYTGGYTDFTLPVNLDRRYTHLNIDAVLVPIWEKLVASKKIIHWFVENRVWTHPKVSTMPVGFNPEEFNPDNREDFPVTVVPLRQRPLKMLQCDRIREGEQWADRNTSHSACLSMPELCQSCYGAYERMNHHDFIHDVASFPFLLCVHGGGIDPSPKAWEAITVGTIPIIEHSALDDAYSQLPVAFVDSIPAFLRWDNITTVLQQWLLELGSYYEQGSQLRSRTLYRLSTVYWYEQVLSHVPKRKPSQ